MDDFSSIRAQCLCTNINSSETRNIVYKHISFIHGTNLTTNRNIISLNIYLVSLYTGALRFTCTNI